MPDVERCVLTVGHSTHPQEDFLALLRAAGIEGVADVRRFPGSRRHPHFAAGALQRWLPEGGLAYDHIPELGGRRASGPGSPNDGWTVPAFRAYADHMESEEFSRGLRRLEELAVQRRTAVMCAEAPWWRCHRRLVADALFVRGWAVRHVMPGGRLADHELPAFAVVDDGRLRYPAEQASLDVG